MCGQGHGDTRHQIRQGQQSWWGHIALMSDQILILFCFFVRFVPNKVGQVGPILYLAVNAKMLELAFLEILQRDSTISNNIFQTRSWSFFVLSVGILVMLWLIWLKGNSFWNVLFPYGHRPNSFISPKIRNGPFGRGKKCPTIQASIYTPLPPLGQCPYENNTFQKGAFLNLTLFAPIARKRVYP